VGGQLPLGGMISTRRGNGDPGVPALKDIHSDNRPEFIAKAVQDWIAAPSGRARSAGQAMPQP